jgi:S1-C subfamily serine protease
MASVGSSAVPPLPPGVPGEGHGEGDDDELEFRPPLPPEDRIWRHPSEVAASGVGASSPRTPRWRRQRTQLAAVGAMSALIGATSSLGIVAALGGFDTDTQVVERQTAVQPVTQLGSDGTTVAAVTDRTAPAVASIRVDRDGTVASGSAVVYRSDGHLVTNAHLVAGATAIVVHLHDERSLPAKVVGTDPVTDLAVLRVDADDLDPAPFGRTPVAVGDTTIAIGCTGEGPWAPAVTTGVVSALDHRMRTADGRTMHGMILVDATLAVATAGGPLLDAHGAVVGITNRPPEGMEIGTATPVELVRHVADQLIERGEARHVWLGVEGEDVEAEDAVAMGLPGGAVVRRVVRDSPAAGVGLEPGDVVVALDDRTIASMSSLISVLRTLDPGDEVVLVVRRSDRRLELTVVLGERG